MAIPVENVISVSIEDEVRAAAKEALGFVGRKMRYSHRDTVASRLAARDEWALGYLAYGLAQNLASFVANLDGNVREAYVLGLEGDDCGSTSFPVVLALSVACRTAALESIVDRVVNALPKVLSEEVALPSESSGGFMDIQVIEVEDISKKRGLGAAIRSLWAPALRVWSRDSDGCAS